MYDKNISPTNVSQHQNLLCSTYKDSNRVVIILQHA